MIEQWAQNWKVGIGVFHDDISEQLQVLIHEERRKAPRLSLSLPLRYHVKDSPQPWHASESVDVSTTGIRIMLDQPVPINSLIEIDFKLPGIKSPFKILGQVRWTKPAFNDSTRVECGLAFKNINQMQQKDHFVHFIADKFCDLSLDREKELVVKLADSREELKEAYTLIHREYLKRGYCKAQPSEMFYTYFCLLTDTRTILITKEKQILGTLTVIPDSPAGLPMENLFPEEIAGLRAQGRKMAEVSLLSLDQEHLGQGMFSLMHYEKHFYFFSLVKKLIDCSKNLGITDLMIAVHPKHEDLYRYMTFSTVASVKAYQGACGNPALPMRWKIEDPVELMPQDSGLRKFLSQPSDPKVLASYVRWNDQNVAEFLIPIWKKIPPSTQAHFHSLYPSLNLELKK